VPPAPEDRLSPFAETIFRQKYSMNGTEEWPDTARRVAVNVMGAIGFGPNSHETTEVQRMIRERKFLPGGRYLYASGRDLHQVQNCLLLRAEDTREGWGDLWQKGGMALMTGAGIGVDYSDVRERNALVRRTGGYASGPVSLMKSMNEIGRQVMQGGSRRSAIWAGLRWSHPDIFEFIRCKDWPGWLRDEKEKDFSVEAPMELTNVSVILDDEFFEAYHTDTHPLNSLAHEVYWKTVEKMVSTGEPGFSVDVGENAGESLRNAPVTAETYVMTDAGYTAVRDLVGKPVTVWTGEQWASDVVFERTQIDAPIVKVTMTGGRTIRCEPGHEFIVERYRGAGGRRRLVSRDRVKAGELSPGDQIMVSLPPTADVEGRDARAYTLGYVYGDGSFNPTGGADLTLCTDESKACLDAMTGWNSVNREDSRGYTRLYFSVDDRWRGRSKDRFPTEMFWAPPSEARSFVAGLFDADGNWEPTQKRIRLACKHEGFIRDVARLLEQLGVLSNVSYGSASSYKPDGEKGWQLAVAAEYMQVFSDTIPTVRVRPRLDGYVPYRQSAVKVISVEPDGREDVYCADVRVPEHSFMAEGVIISNCTEVTSRDDSDICNLGSLNLARIGSIDEMKTSVELASLFLIAGTEYSHVPYEKVARVREQNRRLGLGVMGVHEWLLQRGKRYAADKELGKWLDVYAGSTEVAAGHADALSLSRPVKTRAVAPTGTIGIIGETTTGIEPVFCKAFKRRYLKADAWMHQYVIDPTVRRIVRDHGVKPDDVEDAYQLSHDVGRRLEFQEWVQTHVDHGISSTINLPYPIHDQDEMSAFGRMLIKHLPGLRGVTCYPDGARGGQPLEVASYDYALRQEGVVFEETEDRCVGGACGV
jgi:ribonucleotide reductase alpha subunit